MKIKLLIMCAIFCYAALDAQTSNKIDDANSKVDKTSTSVGNTGNSIENASNAISGLWTKGVDVIKGKKKKKEQTDNSYDISGSYQIIVKNIEYDNPYFNQIFSGIKTTKNVSSVKKSIDENIGTFNFDYNGDISEIWDGLDSKLRQRFKVEKLKTESIIVSYKDN